jgi:hypothetical protein
VTVRNRKHHEQDRQRQDHQDVENLAEHGASSRQVSLFEDDGFTALPAAKAGPRMNAAAP